MPSHDPPKQPDSRLLALVQHLEVDDNDNASLTLKDLDFQVVGLVLSPLSFNKEVEGKAVAAINTRRSRRGLQDLDQADPLHTYLHEVTNNQYDPTKISIKSIVDNVPHVISVRGVDYLSYEALITNAIYDKVKADVSLGLNNVNTDLWPEYIELHFPNKKKKFFYRADVVVKKNGEAATQEEEATLLSAVGQKLPF